MMMLQLVIRRRWQLLNEIFRQTQMGHIFRVRGSFRKGSSGQVDGNSEYKMKINGLTDCSEHIP